MEVLKNSLVSSFIFCTVFCLASSLSKLWMYFRCWVIWVGVLALRGLQFCSLCGVLPPSLLFIGYDGQKHFILCRFSYYGIISRSCSVFLISLPGLYFSWHHLCYILVCPVLACILYDHNTWLLCSFTGVVLVTGRLNWYSVRIACRNLTLSC